MNDAWSNNYPQEPLAQEPLAQEPSTIRFLSPQIRSINRVANIFDVCSAISHNRGYIDHCYEMAESAKNLEYRICIVGHGRSGKDTAAAILAEQLGYKINGSTSYGVIPLVTYALTGRTDITAQNACYGERHNNRMYWYDFCNLLRRVDPLLLLKLTLAQTDMIVGTRSKEEFCNSLDYFKPLNVLWMERRGIPVDPTLEYDRAYVADECNKRGIRHTTIGNNDDVSTLEQQLAWAIKSGLIARDTKC